ncbi:MAG: hypothetical protein JO002_07030 [Burkholderiaceae bacterium]|nr:hypothetical protein [Burkholderiaceae bacterium]
MLTPRSIHAIEWLFQQSIGENVRTADQRAPQISPVVQPPTYDTRTRRRLVVLNLSSYQFRIVALFDFADDDATRHYLCRHARADKLDEQVLLDAHAELVNMICGQVNRSLCDVFRHVGMSTPFFLESDCVSHVALLKPTHTAHLDVNAQDGVRFGVTLCVCTADSARIDFDVDRSQPVEESAGELELF